MELRELKIIYNKVPNFMNYSNGKIMELFIVHKNDKATFLVIIDFNDSSEKQKKGLFNLDLKHNKLNCLSKNDCIEYLEYFDLIRDKKVYSRIKEYVKRSKKDKELIEFNNHFVFIDNNSEILKFNSESTIIFAENKKMIKNNICILHSSPGLNTNYVQIDKNLIQKDEFKNIDYSTKVDLKIKIEDNEYIDFGNIKSTTNYDDKVSFLIEPLEASLLSKNLIGNLNFNKVSPGEIINVMLNTTKSARIGNIDAVNNIKRKFRYITILNNYEIDSDELFIGDIVFSKKIKEVDISKIKPSSSKYTYVSIYIIADNISNAKDEAIQKINNIKNFIELIEKNSCIYEMYNKGIVLSSWNIDKIFIDYK